jgi:hypothetical protein
VSEFFECLIKDCDAAASKGGECVMPGVDFDGREAQFTADRITCAKGHFYHVVNEDKTVKQ